MKKAFLIVRSFALSVGALVLPVAVYAQDSDLVDLEYSSNEGLIGIVGLFYAILKIAIPILLTLAVVFFLWGLVSYMRSDDDLDVEAAKKTMLKGIIAIFIMVSIWGLVAILQNTFNLSGNNVTQEDITGDGSVSELCSFTNDC